MEDEKQKQIGLKKVILRKLSGRLARNDKYLEVTYYPPTVKSIEELLENSNVFYFELSKMVH